MTYFFEDHDVEFFGTRSSITGTAVYEYDVAWEEYGNFRGWTVSGCCLRYVDCDGWHVPPEGIRQIIGTASFDASEAAMGERIEALYAAGDLPCV